jgi:hypothetical protein
MSMVCVYRVYTTDEIGLDICVARFQVSKYLQEERSRSRKKEEKSKSE